MMVNLKILKVMLNLGQLLKAIYYCFNLGGFQKKNQNQIKCRADIKKLFSLDGLKLVFDTKNSN